MLLIGLRSVKRGLEAFWEAYKKVARAVSHIITTDKLAKQLIEKLTPAKVIAEEFKELKKLHHSEWTHDAVAEIINAKIEERAVIMRTKVQRDDHSKSLLDTLQNQVGGKKSQGKDGADPNKPKQN